MLWKSSPLPSLFKTQSSKPPSPQPFQKRSNPTQPLHSMVKPAQPTPNPPESYPQRLQNMVKPIPAVKARSKPPQSHPTFKTRSNPPHPPAPLLNRSNPPRVPNPRRTHPNPTRYSQSLQNMVKPTPNPRAQPCRWGRRPPQNLLLHWALGKLKSGPATRLSIFAVQSPSLPKSFHSAISSKRLCTTAENVEATLVNSPDLEA